MIISAFDQKHYLAGLIRNVHDVLEQHGCALELKIPQRDYSPVSQLRCLEQVIAHKNEYVGGLIVPIVPQDPDRSREDLMDFCNKIAAPVVFLDVEPFETESQYPPRTAFVGYHAAHIGEAAAGWVTEHLFQAQQPPQPGVLVIGGAAQHQRQQKFKEQLAAKLGPSRIIEENAEFDRGRAREVTRKQLKAAKQKGNRLDVIFCTNDEMALGAVDALLTGDRAASRTIVIGVDGTPQARALIEAGPGPLRATVVQDSHKVAEFSIDLLYRLIREEKVPLRTYLPTEVLARN